MLLILDRVKKKQIYLYSFRVTYIPLMRKCPDIIMVRILCMVSGVEIISCEQKRCCLIKSRLKPTLSVRRKPESRPTSRLEKRWIIRNKLSAMKKSFTREIPKDLFSISVDREPNALSYTDRSWVRITRCFWPTWSRTGSCVLEDHRNTPIMWPAKVLNKSQRQKWHILYSIYIYIYI